MAHNTSPLCKLLAFFTLPLPPPLGFKGCRHSLFLCPALPQLKHVIIFSPPVLALPHTRVKQITQQRIATLSAHPLVRVSLAKLKVAFRVGVAVLAVTQRAKCHKALSVLTEAQQPDHIKASLEMQILTLNIMSYFACALRSKSPS